MVCNHCCKRKKKNTVRRGTAVKREGVREETRTLPKVHKTGSQLAITAVIYLSEGKVVIVW